MENQDFIKLLEDLKNKGFVYNDADFCGVGFTIVGAGFIAASLFTMPKNVSIDHRGFVFSLPFRQKKTATLKGDGQK